MSGDSRQPQVTNWAPFPGATRLPHICLVAPETWPVFSGDTHIAVVGGAEVQQSILSRLLARAGHQVSMICLDYGQPPRVVVDGVTVVRAHRPDAGIAGLRFVHPRVTGIWQAMKEIDADIYYQRSAGMLTAVVAAFCRRHGKRSIYASASDSDFIPGEQMVQYRRDRWLFERGLAAVDAVVVQNQVQQDNCLARYRRDSVLIPSCYELPAGTHPEKGETILWVATLRPGKRPELFLELAKRLPGQRFVMVGGAAGNDPGGIAYFDSVRNAARALPNVEFTGFLPLAQVEPYFDRARVVVNTSTVEGMPNVFLQAWARGVPTLAFIDVGAHLDGQAIYPVVDSVEAAADEIERLADDDIHHARAGARCRDYFAATHAGAEVLARYRRVFDDTLACGSRP